MNHHLLVVNQSTYTIYTLYPTKKLSLLLYVLQVKDAALSINPGLVAMACGSFRRGKATCGDVDVLITHPDGKSHKGVFSAILTKLRQSGRATFNFVFMFLSVYVGCWI